MLHIRRSKTENFPYYTFKTAGPGSAIGRAPDWGPGFDTRSDNILSFLLRFFKKGSCQLLAKVCARSTG